MLKRIFGSRNDRLIRRMNKRVKIINGLESDFQSLSDKKLQAKTDEFKSRLSNGEKLDDLLHEAFAVVREASVRVFGMRHFDVQLIGGMVLHNGKIAEMKTGEGKTLMATLPAYLNALEAPVHVVTVNDYLAQRDADWMGQLYKFLGLSVGVILSGQPQEEKQAAYACDIVYGTNNEFGFDYLRDNMVFSAEQKVQSELSFAVIDEVDSILIDEARTPLIISGPADSSADLYSKIDTIVPKLKLQKEEDGPGDYSLDEKSKQAYLTEDGHEKAEQIMEKMGLIEKGASLYDVSNISLLHHLYAAIRANTLFNKDVDYIVQDNQVIIIDEFTGRMMPGRRWSDGLHQAIEAKERVEVQRENQTLASITFQNYFRLYGKLSGMTGTADTEAVEFQQIYDLEVVVIPTHRKMVREDHADVIFRTMREKFNAIVEDVKECHENEQPVLLGTASIEVSELLSKEFKKQGLKHQVLNAKQHGKEAQIIANAGMPGAITIATNMAGRGTDIVLGGNLDIELQGVTAKREIEKIKKHWQERHDKVLEVGGLYVVGTERHESRRIDNQLRGRSGRQGDPGHTRFFLSMEDNLMRIFGSERISNMMQRIGMEEGEAIESKLVTRVIENAQRKVEGHNFDIRKQLLEYDDVANEQRKLVYEERNSLMATEDVSENVDVMREEVVDLVVDRTIPPQSLPEQWNIEQLEEDLAFEFGVEVPAKKWLDEDKALHGETLRDKILEAVDAAYNSKVERYGEPIMRHLEKALTLQVLDTQWKEHLAAMDYLRQGIGLRGYAQKNPKQEYKREAFEMFTAMLDRIKYEIVSILCKVQIRQESELEQLQAQQRSAGDRQMEYLHPESANPGNAASQTNEMATEEESERPFVRAERKIGRNEPCPCGSGKKFKQCHGRLS